MCGAVRDAARDVANDAARGAVRDVAHDALQHLLSTLCVSFVNLFCPNQCAVWLRKKAGCLSYGSVLHTLRLRA